MSKLRASMPKERKNLPFTFAGAFPGEGRDRLGVLALMRRARGNRCVVVMTWFLVPGDPPSRYGKISDFVANAGGSFGVRECHIVAKFRYDQPGVRSVFKRIDLADQATIFDEIVGFTGAKYDPQGKLVYRVEVTLGKKRLEHTVSFSQAVELVDDLPIVLLESASRISELALRREP